MCDCELLLIQLDLEAAEGGIYTLQFGVQLYNLIAFDAFSAWASPVSCLGFNFTLTTFTENEFSWGN